MSTYQLIKNGNVINLVEADDSFVKALVEKGEIDSYLQSDEPMIKDSDTGFFVASESK